MRVEMLPSSIPASGTQFLVSFLINDTIAIDAGAIGFLADLGRQNRIKHVFVTHEHLDHIASLPIFLENVYRPGPDCVELLATRDVLDFLHDDIFNGRVWPDFIRLSHPEDSFVQTTPLEILQPLHRDGLTITPVSVSHGVDTLGLVVEDGISAVAFPSDTGPTEAIWQHLSTVQNLKAVFLEASFPASQAGLATLTGHLSTATFAAEVKKLSSQVRWIIVHRKARFAAEIAREIEAMQIPNVEFVCPGMVYEL